MQTDNTLEIERALRERQRVVTHCTVLIAEAEADILALRLALAPKGDPAVRERPFLPDESPGAYRRRVNGR